jgi:branched-chain amino acid transport system permease protein
MSVTVASETRVAGGIPETTSLAARQRIAIAAALLFIYVLVPLIGSDYWLSALIIPTIVMGLAGIGLNLLMGYAGLISLGAAAFMAVGAFSSYNLLLRVPFLPLPVVLVIAGGIAGVMGVVFGLPSLRIRGFYLSAPTLGAQFFFVWLFVNYRWFSNNSMSLTISAPRLQFLGWNLDSPSGRYLLVAVTTGLLLWLARTIVCSRIGRDWMAIRDMETAAAVAGVAIAKRKLQAYAVSSFICGIAGALWVFGYLGTADANTFDLAKSFQILFIVLIGGSASLFGNFLGAAFIVLTPIVLEVIVPAIGLGDFIGEGAIANIQPVIFGVIIIFLLIREPDGLASLVTRLFRRLTVWPLRM